MNEIWKTIEEYPNYQVSSKGRVKSLKFSKEKILKQGINTKGYFQVVLCKEGKQKSFRVHRLVATAFIQNTENKPHIDHIDTNKQNNNVNNLRWVTQKENCNNSFSKIKYSKAHQKPILQLSKSGKIILGKYNSAKQAENELGIHNSNIIKCCNGKLKSAGKYRWMYYDDFSNLIKWN